MYLSVCLGAHGHACHSCTCVGTSAEEPIVLGRCAYSLDGLPIGCLGKSLGAVSGLEPRDLTAISCVCVLFCSNAFKKVPLN